MQFIAFCVHRAAIIMKVLNCYVFLNNREINKINRRYK
jgi:hypothetical protein